MTRTPSSPSDPSPARAIPPVPDWIARGSRPAGSAQASEGAKFLAGAALAHLHPVATEGVAGVPMPLLRDRMALGAAEAGIVRSGGRARVADLRDRIGLLALGAQMDPETARFALWRRAVTVSLRGQAVPEAIFGADVKTETSLGSPVGTEDGIGAIWRGATWRCPGE